MSIIYKLPNLIKTNIIPLPLNGNKSPYFIYLNYYLNDKNNNICHSKAQKCCGLLAPNKEVYVSKVHKKGNRQSQFVAQLAICNENDKEQLIGINPDNGEAIVKSMLLNNKFKQFKIEEGSLKEQYKYKKDMFKSINAKLDNGKLNHSKFDFSAINEKTGNKMLIEVKSVPLADYENITEKQEKENKKKNIDISKGKNHNDKIAIFPKGFRAKKSNTISPRSIEHIKHLIEIETNKAEHDNIETYIIFVVMRDDVIELQPYIDDPEFVRTLEKAKKSNVNLIALSTNWNANGEIKLQNNDLPIIIPTVEK